MLIIGDVFYGIAEFPQCEIFLKERQNECISPVKCIHFTHKKQKTRYLVPGVGCKIDWSLRIKVITEIFIGIFLFR